MESLAGLVHVIAEDDESVKEFLTNASDFPRILRDGLLSPSVRRGLQEGE